MPKRGQSFFLIFFFLSILIFALSKFNLLNLPQSYLSKAVTTISSPLFFLSDSVVRFSQNDTEKIKSENISLKKDLVDRQKLIEENKALHDQFQISTPRSLDLIAANVLGAPRFIPGLFFPEILIIDVGEKDGVKVGSAVILKENLVGRIAKTTDFLSEVTLVSNTSLRFAAKTESGVLGVVKGQGNGDLILDNVLLSERLDKKQKVLTTGDMRLDSTGFPPNIIIGEVISVEKNPTELFQRAKLQSLIEISKISKVFVVRGLK